MAAEFDRLSESSEDRRTLEPWVEASINEEFARRGEEPWPRSLIGVSAPWGAAQAQYRRGQRCPGCRNLRPRPTEACVICGASYRNPRQVDMQDQPEPAEAGKASSLRGGTGRATRSRRPRPGAGPGGAGGPGPEGGRASRKAAG